MTPCTVTELASLANAQGWLVSNLFQLAPDLWRCNLQSHTAAKVFAEGPDPTSALDAAIAATETVPLIPQPATTWSITPAQPAPDLLTILNLPRQPAVTGPIRRT